MAERGYIAAQIAAQLGQMKGSPVRVRALALAELPGFSGHFLGPAFQSARQ
jgi:hypothetical protein